MIIRIISTATLLFGLLFATPIPISVADNGNATTGEIATTIPMPAIKLDSEGGPGGHN